MGLSIWSNIQVAASITPGGSFKLSELEKAVDNLAVAVKEGNRLLAESGISKEHPRSKPPGEVSTTGPALADASSSVDWNFAREAARDNLAEIELARLAAPKATTDPVKEFATGVYADHTQVQTELQQIANSEKIDLPSQPGALNLTNTSRSVTLAVASSTLRICARK